MGELEKSRQFFEQALDMHVASGEVYPFVLTLLNLALSYIVEEKFDTAEDYLEESLSFIDDKYPLLYAKVRFHYGLIAAGKKQFETARQEHHIALGITKDLDDKILKKQIEVELGKLDKLEDEFFKEQSSHKDMWLVTPIGSDADSSKAVK